MKRSTYLLLLLWLVMPFAGADLLVQAQTQTKAQAPSFKVGVEHDTVGWMGDALNLRLSWECDHPENVRFPVLVDEFANGLQIVPQDTLAQKISGRQGSVTYKFSGYKEGTYSLPAFVFEYAHNGHLYRSYSDTGSVRIFAPEVDTTRDIMDIRGTFKVTRKELRKEYWHKFGFILWILLALAALAAAGWFGYKYLQKRKAGLPVFAPKKPEIPPVEKALAALKALKEKDLWQNGFVKEYHTELTDILRLYLAEALDIPAVEMTNEELRGALRGRSDIVKEQVQNLIETLDTATLVKFAKSQPSADEHTESFARVQTFLDDQYRLYKERKARKEKEEAEAKAKAEAEAKAAAEVAARKESETAANEPKEN